MMMEIAMQKKKRRASQSRGFNYCGLRIVEGRSSDAQDLIKEIKRQLKIRASIECIGPPHVILNGDDLLAILEEINK